MAGMTKNGLINVLTGATLEALDSDFIAGMPGSRTVHEWMTRIESVKFTLRHLAVSQAENRAATVVDRVHAHLQALVAITSISGSCVDNRAITPLIAQLRKHIHEATEELCMIRKSFITQVIAAIDDIKPKNCTAEPTDDKEKIQ